MLVKLPGRAPSRKRALDWLVANGVQHLVLFQDVKIPDSEAAERFKAWIAQGH